MVEVETVLRFVNAQFNRRQEKKWTKLKSREAKEDTSLFVVIIAGACTRAQAQANKILFFANILLSQQKRDKHSALFIPMRFSVAR